MPAASRASADTWFVYILRCGDESLYTGIARDVQARVEAHAAGRGARYTRARGPFEVCAVRRCRSKGEALSLELAIKRLGRKEKLALTLPKRLGAFARQSAAARRSRNADLHSG
ncbi:MAG TPA: GIY-YIG nuclease family protein [Polyangiaceae bacterium]